MRRRLMARAWLFLCEYLQAGKPAKIRVLTALILHEAVPGHTFQGGIAIELKDIPEVPALRRLQRLSEGWALYSES